MYRRPDLYDAIYSYKDYEKEAGLVHDLIQKHKRSKYNKLLDIACGTGKHISFLKQNYRCEGLDSSRFLLEAARTRNPECQFIEGDMRHFELGRWFDAIVCLFSAIGYVKTFESLESTLATFALHTEPGGVVIIEPWLFPENYKSGNIYFDQVDLPDYKVARMSLSQKVGDVSVLTFHFMLGTPQGIETWIDQSELGLFSQADYQVAFERAGLEVEFDPQGFAGRGLFIGRKPL